MKYDAYMMKSGAGVKDAFATSQMFPPPDFIIFIV